MASYIALLRKEKGSDYGVEFPDFPGCVSAGRTLEEARVAAQEALELHLEGMAEEGQAIPEPISLDAIFASDWDTEGAVPFLVTPAEPETRVVRVNVTFKPAVLRVLDGYAELQGLTRAAALERAVHDVVRSTNAPVRMVRDLVAATAQNARARAKRSRRARARA